MTLPEVRVVLNLDGSGEVWVDGAQLPGVLAVQIIGANGHLPQVSVTLRPDQVVANLPETGVQVLQAGPSATEFASSLQPQRLEQDALTHDDLTMGESFALAVVVQAAEFDASR